MHLPTRRVSQSWQVVKSFQSPAGFLVHLKCVRTLLIQKTMASSRSKGSSLEALKVEKRLTEATTFSMLIISTVYAIMRASIIEMWALCEKEKKGHSIMIRFYFLISKDGDVTKKSKQRLAEKDTWLGRLYLTTISRWFWLEVQTMGIDCRINHWIRLPFHFATTLRFSILAVRNMMWASQEWGYQLHKHISGEHYKM